MGNTFRKGEVETDKSNTKPSGKGLFSAIEKTFRLDGIFDEGVPLKYLPKILWITFLIILYISNAHYTEKTIRKIDRLKYEVEDLRTDYTTLKASYMFDSKQSEVAKKVAVIGLEESKNPPLIIEIKK